MTKPIVVVGSINIDLVAAADRIPQAGETILGDAFNTYPGGKGANQAVAAAKLGYPVQMFGCVGDDIFSSQLRDGLKNAGVDTTYVQQIAGSSGVALITTGRTGENNIVYVPGANSHVLPKVLERNRSVLQAAGAFLIQLETPFETVEWLAAFAQQEQVPLILDPAPARDLPASLLKQVTWLTPNETETEELLKGRTLSMGEDTYAKAADLQAAGARNVLLKLGSRGCVIAESGRPPRSIPAFPVTPVDTTAAGDGFNAGFAVAMLRGHSIADSARFASAVAAISVTRRGAQPSMPTGEEVTSFLASQHA